MAEERIEDRLDDDAEGLMRRRVSAEELDRPADDDVAGSRRRSPGLTETEDDVEGHKKH